MTRRGGDKKGHKTKCNLDKNITHSIKKPLKMGTTCQCRRTGHNVYAMVQRHVNHDNCLQNPTSQKGSIGLLPQQGMRRFESTQCHRPPPALVVTLMHAKHCKHNSVTVQLVTLQNKKMSKVGVRIKCVWPLHCLE